MKKKVLLAICHGDSIDFNHEIVSWGHGYDEIGIVVKGELEIELDKTLYHLYEGDSIFIKQNTPHRYRNPGFTSSLVYWVSSKK